MSAKQAKLLFLVLIVLVALLFFMHVPSGGFQAKNGPTTPVNNLAGLFLMFAAGTIVITYAKVIRSPLSHLSPQFLPSPAAGSIGISLRC